eukprot:4018750-Amphidinium_carterae.1
MSIVSTDLPDYSRLFHVVLNVYMVDREGGVTESFRIAVTMSVIINVKGVLICDCPKHCYHVKMNVQC